MSSVLFKRREIIECFSNKHGVDVVNVSVNYIVKKLNLQIRDIQTEKLEKLKVALKALRSRFYIKWEALKRTQKKFWAKNVAWLNPAFKIPNLINSETHLNETVSLAGPGSLSTSFELKSERSKRRDATAISNENQNDPQWILMACR